MFEDGVSIKIEGLNELGSRLLAFSEKVQKKVIRDGANEAAKVFQAEAIHNIETTTKNMKDHLLKVKGEYVLIHPGNLAKNIKIKTLKKMVNGQIDVEIYLKKDHAWYGIFVERGKSNMAANPFMARAFEAKRDEVPGIFKERIEQAIREGGI